MKLIIKYAILTLITASIVLLAACSDDPKNAKVTYMAPLDQVRTITLADGSKVILNADSQLQVAFDENTRELTLISGEAYFIVAEDNRPFKVYGGTSDITADVSSAFEMWANKERMVVSVEKGRIVVKPQSDASQKKEVKEWERLAIADYQLGEVKTLNELNDNWRDGWLEFNDIPLEEAIAELDKYYKGNISLEGDLSDLRISGRFHIPDMRKTLRIVAKSMRLKMTTSNNGDVTLSERQVN